MAEIQKSRWRQEFDALPPWAQKLVTALQGLACTSYGAKIDLPFLDEEKHKSITLTLKKEGHGDFADGLDGACELARALTAPWPPPSDLPPHEKMTTGNLVEIFTAGDDDCAFDQPCYFGHRVETYAVYCHNEAWPHAPRKCRRNRDDFRHEDCPGFVANKTK